MYQKNHGLEVGAIAKLKKRLDQTLKIGDVDGVKITLDGYFVTFLQKAREFDCIVAGPILKEAAQCKTIK